MNIKKNWLAMKNHFNKELLKYTFIISISLVCLYIRTRADFDNCIHNNKPICTYEEPLLWQLSTQAFVDYTTKEKPISEVNTQPIKEEKIEEQECKLSDFEIEYLAKCTMAEAGNQDEVGKRLVIDCILNRLNDENFPNSIADIINYPGQFEVVSNGSINVIVPTPDIYTLIEEELISPYNTEVLYFRTSHFHNFGTPLFQWGAHYFSK